jgi:hypothetical protein
MRLCVYYVSAWCVYATDRHIIPHTTQNFINQILNWYVNSEGKEDGTQLLKY